MIFLFRSGSLRSKSLLVYKATRQHARNLGLFALVYKSTMLFLRYTSPTGKERHYDAFLAGLLGGYTVFGRTIHNSVSQQIVIYVAARVCLALAKLAVQPRHVGGGHSGVGVKGASGGFELFGNGDLRRAMVRNGWPAFASLSWAMVMYIFRWHPESVQSSLRSSMSYMWVSRRRLCGIESANAVIVMCSRIIGIRCGRCCGITNNESGAPMDGGKSEEHGLADHVLDSHHKESKRKYNIFRQTVSFTIGIYNCNSLVHLLIPFIPLLHLKISTSMMRI
tara:strand:+ start:8213 stop:9049 length:837 start_codon:yes stop_codon:yes gene_type:complete